MRAVPWITVAFVLVLVAACQPERAGDRPPDGAVPTSDSNVTPATPHDGRPTDAPSPSSAPAFVGSARPIDRALRERLVGRNWHPGCPVPIRELRLVEVSYRNLRGDVRTGPLVLHEDVAVDVRWVFRRLFRAGFPIHRIGLPPRYRAPRPEDRSNTRNLSSSFNCRPATGSPGSLSHHSYGWAIDINPLQNPYVRSDGTVLRRAVKPFVDRTRRHPGMIRPDDVVVRSFARIGWEWGGDWQTLKDYMHFSLTGR